MIRVHFIFEGIVQGVGFRYAAHSLALRYGLNGYVKNLSDGTVEMVVQGEKTSISEFVDQLSQNRFINIFSIQKTLLPLKEESSFRLEL